MIRIRHALLAVSVVCTPALAQRGGGTGRERPRQTDADYRGMLANSPLALRLSNGDVEEMDPVRLLVDKRKDLKLTDDQQRQLKDLETKVKETNKPHFRQLDSLRQAMRPRAGEDPDVERARTALAREAVVGVVRAIRDNYAASLKEALPLLDAAQQPRADELLKKQAEKAEETLREKLGGRGGRGGYLN
jgi:ribosomal protein L7/L12